MVVPINVTFTRIASGQYLEEDKLKHVPRWIKAKLEKHENPNTTFNSVSIEGKGKYQNATCVHVAYLYWRYLIAKKDPNSQYLLTTFNLLLKDPRTDVRATFTEELLYDRGEAGHFAPVDSYDGDYIEHGNLAHYALLEDDFRTMKKVVFLAPDLMNSVCSTVTRRWFLESFRIDEIKSVKLLDPDKNQFIMTKNPSKELLCKIKNSTNNGRLAIFNWTEGTYSEVFRRSNVALSHIAMRKGNRIASIFIASTQKAILDSEGQHAAEYGQQIKTCEMDCSEASTFDMSEIIDALETIEPLPNLLPHAYTIEHKTGYDMLYCPITKSSIVRYVLYKALLVSNQIGSRRPGYKEDKTIPEISRAIKNDYKNSGMVFGHLVPHADSRYSEKALQDAYLLTNFVPQDPEMNNGLWKRLENKVRKMAKQHLCLHVYTGGVNKPKKVRGAKFISHPVIGEGNVRVPTHLFKVIYFFDYPEMLRHTAYLVPNKPGNTTLLEKYKVDLDQIQKLSGMDFEGYYQNYYPDWIGTSDSTE